MIEELISQIPTEVMSAIISGIVALSIACWNSRQLRSEFILREKELKNRIWSDLIRIRSRYSEQLLLKRMEVYPELIRITQELGKDLLADKIQVRKNHENAYIDLKRWQTETGGTLYLSSKSIDAFYKLIHILNFRNIPKNISLDDRKIQSIRKKRDVFRKSLHRDLVILQENEDYIKSSLKY